MAYQQNFGARQRPPQHHGNGMHIPVGLVGLAIVLILIIGGAYYLITSGGSSVAISSAQNINVGTAGTVVSMGGAEYMIALSKAYPSSGLAFAYVNKLPMFVNPIFNVSISTTSPTKLSTATKNGYANIQLEAVSITNNSMVLKVTPLDTSLAISPDYGKSTEIEPYFGNGTVGESLISTPGTNTTTTTVPPVISSGSTTVASTSTTTVAANNTNANILAGLHKSVYYPVLVNLSTLYANTQQCNPTDYNSAYIHEYSHAPVPPSDYANQSQLVPYTMYTNITNEGNGNYGVVYRTTSQLLGDGPAVTISINGQTANVVNTTFSSSGIFGGSATVSDLKGAYNRAVMIGGNCGIEVP